MNKTEKTTFSRRSAITTLLFGLSLLPLKKVRGGGGAAAPELRGAQGRKKVPAPKIETDADIDKLLPELSNWGRWGADDQLGTLNLITPEKRRRAANSVKSGRTVALARQVSVARTEGIRRGTYEMLKDEGGSRDYVAMIFHGFAQTHLDALCHVFAAQNPATRGKMYNGFSTGEVAAEGAKKLGAERMAENGVCGRGVLLDVAALRGAPLAPGTPIYIKDLEDAERNQKVRVESGDVLFVRNGAGLANSRERRSGLHPECLVWLREREVALLGGDGDSDASPLAGFERWASAMHSFAIPFLGLPLLDNAELDALGRACREEKRWSFLVTIAPWRFEGTTSSPVNPIVLF